MQQRVLSNFQRMGDLEIVTVDDIKRFATNDFEEIVFTAYPEIKKIKEGLYSLGANFVLMTGTGSTLYAIFSNLQKANSAREYYKNKYYTFLNYPVNKGSIT